MMRWIVLAMLLVPLAAFAADFWDGNAALQRGDADFESGLNVASNSFPPGTKITIQNQDTGRTVTATVTGRIEGQSDILLLMSPKTAAALGVGQGTLGRVRVTEPPHTDLAAAQPGNQTVSRDPDVNPDAAPPSAEAAQLAQAPENAAAAAAPAAGGEAPAGEQPAAGGQPSETGEQAQAPTTSPDQLAQAGPAADQAGATPPAASSATADDAAILSQAESRNPQKEMFQPPREDQKFVYHPEAPAQTGTPAAPQPSATVASVSEPGLTPPAPPQSNLPLADVVAPEESRPEEIVGTGTAVPGPAPAPLAALAAPEVSPESSAAPGPVQAEVSGPPATPPAASSSSVALAPPEAPSTETRPAATPAQKPSAVAATASRPRTGADTYYLQLAAYGSEKGARDLAAKLAPTYPALVLAPTSPGGSIYKVVIGPLNRAESGTLLTWFRYRGFPDAFLKQE